MIKNIIEHQIKARLDSNGSDIFKMADAVRSQEFKDLEVEKSNILMMKLRNFAILTVNQTGLIYVLQRMWN